MFGYFASVSVPGIFVSISVFWDFFWARGCMFGVFDFLTFLTT